MINLNAYEFVCRFCSLAAACADKAHELLTQDPPNHELAAKYASRDGVAQINAAMREKHGKAFPWDDLKVALRTGEWPTKKGMAATENTLKQYRSNCSTAIQLAGFSPDQFGLDDRRGTDPKPEKTAKQLRVYSVDDPRIKAEFEALIADLEGDDESDNS